MVLHPGSNVINPVAILEEQGEEVVQEHEGDGGQEVEQEEDSDFAFYFLANDTLGAYEAMQQEITELELKREPWLCETDIEFYDFSSHCIYLKTDKGDYFEYYDKGYFDPVLIDKPFVVVAGGTRCYVGSLHSGALSMSPPGPYMAELDVWFYPKDVMHISEAWSGEEDIRSMDQIREALTILNLYHGGLSLSLDAVGVIENTDTATVQYTFTITNDDGDDLLILDPDCMGSAQFHYFTIGVYFWQGSTLFYSQYKDVTIPEPFDSWEQEWFTTIKAGGSIQRTVQLKGYPKIPAGSYNCCLRFSNPPKIEKADRYSSSARYWLGEITSDEIVYELDRDLVIVETPDLPQSYHLYQNYPNPFNPTTTIRFDLPQATNVALDVCDVVGREVTRLLEGYVEPGCHQAQWSGKDQSGRIVPSGIYIARLVTPEYSKAIKMVLLK